MKHHKIILFISILLIGQNAFCAQQSSQILSTSLPQVLEIEKILVETAQYDRDEPMPSTRVRETKNVDNNNTLLFLSPMRVQIRTNSSTPITVTAQFKELKHKQGLYDFNPSDLAVEPTSYTINDPYDHIITDIFRPIVDVKPDTALGMYRGSMFFTLGAI